MDNLMLHTSFTSEANARDEATKFLTTIFDDKLMNIDSLKSSITEIHKYENKAYLDILSKIERSIAGSYESAKKIDTVIQNLTAIEQSLVSTCNQWEDITKTLNHYGKNLENIMNSKRNISMMLANLNTYVGIQAQVEELERLFESESNIVYVYKQVRYISFLRNEIILKVKSVTRSEKLNNLADHLICIQKFEEVFWDKFWGYFSNVIELSIKKPEFLVKLLRLIDEDPDYIKLIKNQYSKAKTEGKGLKRRNSEVPGEPKKVFNKGWLATTSEKDPTVNPDICTQKIEKSINNKLTIELGSKEDLSSIVEVSLILANDLKKVSKFVAPCFPPSYRITKVFQKMYIDFICGKIKKFLDEKALQANPGNLIILAKWLDSFEGLLQEIGVDIRDTDLDVEYYMHVFYEHVDNILVENSTNILNRDAEDKANIFKSKLKPSEITSYYSRDIFNCLYNVINLLSGDLKGNVLYQVIGRVINKLKEIQQKQKEKLEQLESSDDLILACVYVTDADNCSESLPDFKKNLKTLLSEEYHAHIKNSLKYVGNLFSATNTSGCKKIIELMFIDIEKNLLRKLFTSEWSSDILLGIFQTFGNFFNKGFCKIIKNESILTMIIRIFVDNFLNYYFDELIYTIRTIFKKQVTPEMTVYKYRFKHIKCLDHEEDKKKEKDKEKGEKEKNEKGRKDKGFDANDATQIKVLDKLIVTKDTWMKSPKKYNMAIKVLKEEDRKNFNPEVFSEKIHKDYKLFSDFLQSFKEDTKEPFTKQIQCNFGDNFINTYLNKFRAALEILKISKPKILEFIKTTYKEYFHGTEGKNLMEILVLTRKDSKEFLKTDDKRLMNDVYDARIA